MRGFLGWFVENPHLQQSGVYLPTKDVLPNAFTVFHIRVTSPYSSFT